MEHYVDIDSGPNSDCAVDVYNGAQYLSTLQIARWVGLTDGRRKVGLGELQ